MPLVHSYCEILWLEKLRKSKPEYFQQSIGRENQMASKVGNKITFLKN